MAQSEVAQLLQRLADEYQSAQWGLTGLAYGMSKHQFITAKMENMGKARQKRRPSLLSRSKRCGRQEIG